MWPMAGPADLCVLFLLSLRTPSLAALFIFVHLIWGYFSCR